MTKILVTGAGALLGQGILRSLRYADNEYYIVSADPDIRSTGHALADKSFTIPYVTDPEYITRIEEILESEKIDIILIGTDVELPIFAKQQKDLEERFNLKVVVSGLEAVDIANDKFLTAEFLQANGFPFPMSALTSDDKGIQELKAHAQFPLIAKPVDGARSKGIKVINSTEELDEICSYKNNLVVQEKITEQEGEFTTGCIVTNGKCHAVVSLTRDLRDGNTWRAYRNGTSPYDNTIARIAEKLGIEGPANFQYRIRNGQPVIFEVNCRFSGTTPLRYMFGFNEVDALVQYYMEGKEIEQPVLRNGTVLRTFSDIFVPNEELEKFSQEGVIENYAADYYPFKGN
jgi:carbamoyl-phosphate synthase large subunit